MLLTYSGLHLYEEAVLGFPLPLRERDRVRGKAVATHLLIQTKSAVGSRRNKPCRIYPDGLQSSPVGRAALAWRRRAGWRARACASSWRTSRKRRWTRR